MAKQNPGDPQEQLRFATEDAEWALVGSLLMDPSASPLARSIVTPDELLFPTCRDLYSATLAALERHGAADLLLIVATAQKLGLGVKQEEVQMALARAPFAPNVQHYAVLCRDYARRRQCVELASNVALASHDLSSEYGAEIARVAWRLLQTSGTVEAEATSPRDVADGVLAQYEEYAADPQQVRGVGTGMRSIDTMLGGLPSGLIVVGAGTHVGKTAWACSLARNAAAEGRRVLYFTREMKASQLAGRLVLSVARVDIMTAWKGECSEAEMETIRASAHIIGDLPLVWIDAQEASTIADVAARTYREKAERGVSLVVLDSLGLYVPRSGDNRNLRMGEATLGLLSLASAVDLPIVALHHVGRATEGRKEKRPQLTDYLWSSYVERDADIAAFLWREELNTRKADGTPNPAGRMMEFIVRKNRLTGRIGTAMLYFGEFAEVETLSSGGPPTEEIHLEGYEQEEIPL